MRILNGWKEIADCLHLSPRSAQRWEQLGLPVRRVSDSARSPIIAASDEIQRWVRARRRRPNGFDSLIANTEAFRETRRESRELIGKLKAARTEHRRLLDAIHDQLGNKPLR
jgi:hypothetical protein